MSEMKTDHQRFLQSQTRCHEYQFGYQLAFAVNELIQPNAVILSHANEAATSGGKVNPGTRSMQFIDLVKNWSVTSAFKL